MGNLAVINDQKVYGNKKMPKTISTRKNMSENNNDVILSFKQENKKSWLSENFATIGFGLAGVVAVASIFRNVQLSKRLADVSTRLSQTTNELNATKTALSEAEGVIMNIQQLANTPAKNSIKNTLVTVIKNATKGLKLTNELGAECGKLCENVGNIKRLIG